MTPLANGLYPADRSPATNVLTSGPALVGRAGGGLSAVDLGAAPPDGDVYHHRAPDFLDLLEDLLPYDPRTADRVRDAATALPEAGHLFHGFSLVREIGRGAFARVFLARQPSVADRHVVVKVTADAGGEVRALAQLRHTNIVPVHSVHPAGAVQIIVMPYLGEHTLAELVFAVHHHGIPTGGAAIAALCRTPAVTGSCERGSSEAAGPAERCPTFPAVETLRKLPYVDAVLWLATRLAEGLAFAHAHGIVHCDLKPANALLTAAGEPMLLDFNVADDTKPRGGPGVAVVGGSFPYMAPEQLAAFQGRRESVDARCDLYAFGVMLYELLTGRSPFATPGSCETGLLERACQDRLAPPPSVRPHNPAVPPALEAIVRRCLQGDPARRYQSAADLLDDLRRQQDGRPLRVAGNPSVRERGRKFVRRHPGLTSATGVAALAGGLLVVAALALAGYRHQLTAAADRVAAAETWAAFRDEARAAQYRLAARADDIDQLRAGANLARTALHRYGLPDDANGLARSAALPADDRNRLRETAGDLLLHLARAVAADSAADRVAEAERLISLAEACNPDLADAPALWAQRADLAAARGDAATAGELRAKANALPLRTARDHYWRAGDLAAHGRLREALPLLREAAGREPHNVWAWLLLGNAYLDAGRPDRAEFCYDLVAALWPDFPWAWYNRGLARLHQKDYARAADDFTRCLDLRPEAVEAHIDRALAEQGRGRLAEAEADLTRAIDLGARDTRLYFLRARVRTKRGDAAGAAADRAEGEKREPADEKSRIARGIDRLARDPKGALADFVAAERLNPRSVVALQNQAHVLSERLNRPADAVAALDRAAALRPESAEVLCGRGVVLARLGRYDAARRDADVALRVDPSPARRYQAACVYALTSPDRTSDALQALALLAGALRDGYGHDILAADHDLDPVRDRAEFRRLADAAAALKARRN